MKIYKIKVNGKTYKVELEAMEEVASAAAPKVEAKKEETPKAAPVSGEGNKVLSPIQGTVLDVKVKVGDTVKAGQKAVEVDWPTLMGAGLDTSTMLIVSEPVEGVTYSFRETGPVDKSDGSLSREAMNSINDSE